MINTKFLSDRTRIHIWNRLQDLISFEADYKIGNTYFMDDSHRTFGVDNFWAVFVGDSSWRLFLPSEGQEMNAYRALSGIPMKSVVIESVRLIVYPDGYGGRRRLIVGEEDFAKGLL